MTEKRREEEPPAPERAATAHEALPGGRVDRAAEDTVGGSRTDPIGRLHRSAGNQAVGAMLSSTEVSSPTSPAEREAERVASQVVSGGSPASVARTADDSTVQRQPDEGSKREEEKRRAEFLNQQLSGSDRPQSAEYEEAAKTTGRALLQTPFGQRLKNQAENMGTTFWGHLAGKVTTISLASGAVTGLAVANEELPVQPPSFPADAIVPGLEVPGLRMGVTYEGPLRQPSKVMLKFSFSPGGGESTTASDSGGGSGSNLSRELFKFRQSLKSEQQLNAERRLLWEEIGGIPPGLSPFAPPGGEMGAAPEAAGEGGEGGDEGGGGSGSGSGSGSESGNSG